jgi:putative MATE family efflux protein
MKKIKLKEINRLAGPAIIAGIAEPVISLVDTAFIGRLGTSELAAVGIASSFYLMVIWVLAQTKSAISAIVSRYYGQQKLADINSLIPQAFAANFLLGILVISITVPLAVPIFKLYYASGDVLQFARSYYSIRAWGFPVTLATFILFGVFRGLQNTSWAMQISIIGGVVNLVADYILIFGFGPIPAFGVDGAAYGSLFSQIVMLSLAIVYLHKKTTYRIHWARKIHKDLKWLFGMSFDFYIRTISLNLALYQSTRMASAMGEAVIAAHTIAINIWLFSAFFIDGYANAANALSGRLFGERNFNGLKQMAKSILWISVVIGSLLGLVYLIGYRSIPHVFTEDEIVIHYFLSIFWMLILMQPINAVAFAYDGIFKGLGEAKLLRNTLLISTFLVFFPFAWLSDYLEWGFYAVWGSLMIWMISRGGLLAILFGKWLKRFAEGKVSL